MSDIYLLSANEIAAMEGRAKTHFLNDGAKRINKSLGDATGLTGLGIHIIEVAPGAGTSEYHLHHHEEEAIYVLAGAATARIGDAYHPIGPGDFIGYRKGGLAHTITNTGPETLRLLVIGQRLPHDVCDYPELGKRLYRQADLIPDLVAHSALTHPLPGPKK